MTTFDDLATKLSEPSQEESSETNSGSVKAHDNLDGLEFLEYFILIRLTMIPLLYQRSYLIIPVNLVSMLLAWINLPV